MLELLNISVVLCAVIFVSADFHVDYQKNKLFEPWQQVFKVNTSLPLSLRSHLSFQF